MNNRIKIRTYKSSDNERILTRLKFNHSLVIKGVVSQEKFSNKWP